MSKTEFVIKKEECRCDEDDVTSYAAVLNGIVKECSFGYWCEGFRNRVIVDMAVASWMLGIDPETTLDELVKAQVIDPAVDDEDTYDRLSRVMRYTESFEWAWMIDPDEYFTTGVIITNLDSLPVCFKVEG